MLGFDMLDVSRDELGLHNVALVFAHLMSYTQRSCNMELHVK